MAYKKIDIKQYADDQSRSALARFLNAWGGKNWVTMLDGCQKTWKRDNSVEKLKPFFKDKVLLTAQIGNEADVSPLKNDVVKDFQVAISFKMPLWSKDKKIHKETILARLVCESVPGSADKNGTWGVNPISTLRKI